MLNGIMGEERGKYELAVENIFHKGFRLLGTLSSINREYYIPHGYEINWPVFFFFFFLWEKEYKIRRIVREGENMNHVLKRYIFMKIIESNDILHSIWLQDNLMLGEKKEKKNCFPRK